MAYRIAIVDNCLQVAPTDSYLYRKLREHFDVCLSEEPDYLFYTVFGFEHTMPKYDHCVRIWFTGENFRPDFSRCDYAMSFDYLPGEPRHVRLPIYLHYTGRQGSLIKPVDLKVQATLLAKTKFCNFVYSNALAETRIKFLQRLSEYKKVDSAGFLLNNTGFRVSDKQAFLRDYKFTIAFENARHPGYTTEKLVEPMLSGSMPIYWGNSEVGLEFNTKSFVNCHEYDTFEDVIEEIVQLDQDDGRYIAKMREPWLIGNRDSSYTMDDYLVPFFRKVFATPRHSYRKWAGIVPENYGLNVGKVPQPIHTEAVQTRVFE